MVTVHFAVSHYLTLTLILPQQAGNGGMENGEMGRHGWLDGICIIVPVDISGHAEISNLSDTLRTPTRQKAVASSDITESQTICILATF